MMLFVSQSFFDPRLEKQLFSLDILSPVTSCGSWSSREYKDTQLTYRIEELFNRIRSFCIVRFSEGLNRIRMMMSVEMLQKMQRPS
jgi:hypothetical protein